MAGSIKDTRKGKRPMVGKMQPVTQQMSSGAKPKSMTAGKAKPATSWFK